MTKRDKAFIQKMHDLYNLSMMKHIYRFEGDEDVARDIAQEVYCSMAVRVKEIKKFNHPDQWMYQTAYGKLLHYWRSNKKDNTYIFRFVI